MKTYITIAALALLVAIPIGIHAETNRGERMNAGSKADWACVSTATGVREDAIISAFESFNSSMISALKARKTALVAANAKTEKSERQAARKSAWNTFKTAKKNAAAEYRTDRKDAFKAFATTVKTTCKTPTAASEESENATVDPVL